MKDSLPPSPHTSPHHKNKGHAPSGPPRKQDVRPQTQSMLKTKRQKAYAIILTCISLFSPLYAQESTTNAFDDLKRKGTVNEQESVMRIKASDTAISKLLSENPVEGFFCFTEDRNHDIRLTRTIPQRWADRPAECRNSFKGKCQPGEFFTWQIGLYSPYKELRDVTISFSKFKNEKGRKIPASSFRCFNLGGVDTNGRLFKKKVNINKGCVQALWMGAEIPENSTGTYKGTVTISASNAKPIIINCELNASGFAVSNHGDDLGKNKTRLRWLDSSIGNSNEPTAPYTSLQLNERTISWLGGKLKVSKSGLPEALSTCYDQSNKLSNQTNSVLAQGMRFVIETENGPELLSLGRVKFTERGKATIKWEANQQNDHFKVVCEGCFGFDGLAEYKIHVKALSDAKVKDIRLEVPYTKYASKYIMGLGKTGGIRPKEPINWHWDTRKHQDKIWMGNVNAGLNFCFKDENYKRPLVNVYYELGRLKLPTSWGNGLKGGISIIQNGEEVLMTAFSGERNLKKGEQLHYNFSMLVTPVKPVDLNVMVKNRFYHSNSDISANYIPEALKAGANMVNVHHKKDIYPFINYPYYDGSVSELKQFIDNAHEKGLGVRLYYTTRELTVKTPEIWALRSLGGEVIHDGPGKDARTLIHRNGPHKWLNDNLGDHFIPAWYNAFSKGKYAGDMDLSIITTPDSRWNNYYLEGLDWMIKNLGIDGVYIDDSALDHKTMQRARRILDKDGKRRLIDIHSWNHMNQWAGYANSIHLYLELLPYVDRTWLGEGFSAKNTPDFWLVEMSGIPFGLMSETLDAHNLFRGLIYGMLPRLPWSGNPVEMWKIWDKFGMENATMRGYWDKRCPIKTDNKDIPATVFVNGNKAMVILANWTESTQSVRVSIDENLLGFKPTSFIMPEIKNAQQGKLLPSLDSCEITGQGGMVVLLSK